jgi:hypothetical protein
LGVIVSNWFGLDNIVTVRFIFLIFGCLSVVGVFLIGRTLFNSPLIGIFSSITMLSFYGFGLMTSFGPRPKVPMVFFISMAIFYTIEKKWFKAGLFGSLSFFTWQPAGIFLPLIIILSLTQEKIDRKLSFLRSLIGAAVPTIFIVAYFYFEGGLYEMINASYFFPFRYMEVSNKTFFSQILYLHSRAVKGYASSIVAFYIGLLMIFYFYYWRFRVKNSINETLLKDRFAILLLSFPPLVIWSFKDFQSFPDFFIFLPFISIGFGYFLSIITLKFEKTNYNGYRLLKKHFSSITIILIILSISFFNAYEGRSNQLLEQKSAATEIEKIFGEDAKILSLGDPTILVLLHKTNPNRYLFITRGFDRLIEDTYPEGIEGWIGDIEEYDPDVISFGIMKGESKQKIIDWMTSNYQLKKQGSFKTYVKYEQVERDS